MCSLMGPWPLSKLQSRQTIQLYNIAVLVIDPSYEMVNRICVTSVDLR